jgi:hypothetical protein
MINLIIVTKIFNGEYLPKNLFLAKNGKQLKLKILMITMKYLIWGALEVESLV